MSAAHADQLLLSDVETEARLCLSCLSPGAVDVGGESHVERLVEAPTNRRRAQPHLVLRADREPRRERIGLRVVLDLQPEADVADDDADAQRTAWAGADTELPAE